MSSRVDIYYEWGRILNEKKIEKQTFYEVETFFRGGKKIQTNTLVLVDFFSEGENTLQEKQSTEENTLGERNERVG